MSLYKVWPKYPKELDAKNWDKERGILSKIFKQETGIGKQLREAEKAFDAIEPAYFSDNVVDTSTKAACDEAVTKLEKEFNKSVKPFNDAMKATQDLADKVAKEFKKHKLIPKSSTAYVKSISDKAAEFSDDIRQFVMDAKSDIKEAKKTAT